MRSSLITRAAISDVLSQLQNIEAQTELARSSASQIELALTNLITSVYRDLNTQIDLCSRVKRLQSRLDEAFTYLLTSDNQPKPRPLTFINPTTPSGVLATNSSGVVNVITGPNFSVLRVLNGIPSFTGSLSISSFGKQGISLDGSGVITEAYSPAYTAVPSFLRATLYCAVANNGYVIGDEIDALSVMWGTPRRPAFSLSSSKESMTVTKTYTSTDTLYIANKSTGADVALTKSQWTLSMYALP
jgi:hypothetical protein